MALYSPFPLPRRESRRLGWDGFSPPFATVDPWKPLNTSSSPANHLKLFGLGAGTRPKPCQPTMNPASFFPASRPSNLPYFRSSLPFVRPLSLPSGRHAAPPFLMAHATSSHPQEALEYPDTPSPPLQNPKDPYSYGLGCQLRVCAS